MAGPSTKVIAKLRKRDRDPELLRHLENADQVFYPQGEVRHDLNQRVMAQIARRESRLERRSTRWEHAFSGILVSVGTGAFLLARMGEAFAAPIAAVLGCTVMTAIAASLFFLRQEAKQVGVSSRTS